MRKVSKSRTEDDIVSSTNGSANIETGEQVEKADSEENTEEIEPAQEDAEFDEKADDNYDPAKKTSKKKTGRPKSKKSKTETETEYEVEKIIDSKKIKGKLHYLLRWKGYGSDNDTWEPAHTVSCPDLITKFNEEKENSKSKDDKKAGKKRKGSKKKEATPKRKKTNTVWDSENADETAEYEVDRILEVHHKKNGKREFLIHWKGWSNKFDSWEPENNLNCPDLIKKFMDKVESARTTDSRSLRVAPETTNRFTLQAQGKGRRLSKRRGQKQRVRYDNAE